MTSRTALTSPPPLPVNADAARRVLLLILEGANDIDFLLRLTGRLHVEASELPNLPALVNQGRVIPLPLGGGDAATWPLRFAPLGHLEFHLYDREQGAEVAIRLQAITSVNLRPGCYGFVTRKRSLENYLHPAAIAAAGEAHVQFGDDDSVAELVARARRPEGWTALTWRRRRQLVQQTKRRLNTVAVEQMNLRMLAERDPEGEVLGWLRTMQRLLGE